MTDTPRISARLLYAANYARQNKRIADVGTDHAYLPIYLLAKGISLGGVVSDINKGPIERAKEHIREWGYCDRLDALLCDGLDKIEPYRPDDIFILGMGGELIADIIMRAPWTKTRGVRLILQPMTHPELLRKALCENGYSIVDEALVKDGKIYQLICAEYTGESVEQSELELLFGAINLSRRDALCAELLGHWENVLMQRIRGKREADADTSDEERILKMIGDIKNECN